jgi:hypothetical protein
VDALQTRNKANRKQHWRSRHLNIANETHDNLQTKKKGIHLMYVVAS